MAFNLGFVLRSSLNCAVCYQYTCFGRDLQGEREIGPGRMQDRHRGPKCCRQIEKMMLE